MTFLDVFEMYLMIVYINSQCLVNMLLKLGNIWSKFININAGHLTYFVCHDIIKTTSVCNAVQLSSGACFWENIIEIIVAMLHRLVTELISVRRCLQK